MTQTPPDVGDVTRRDRGVSDVVAFVFVFSIIITSVGIVSAVGFTVLEDIQASEQSINAERGFESLGYNLGNIQRGHAPGRTGEIKLSGGRILVADNAPAVEVTTPGGFSKTLTMGSLQYDMESRETSIAYESGAVFRSDRGGVVAVVRPKFICRSDHAIVSIVTLRSDADVHGGEGTVQVIGREEKSELLLHETGVSSVDVSVTNSEFQQGWDRILDDEGWNSGTCDFRGTGSGTLIVRHTVINIQFIT